MNLISTELKLVARQAMKDVFDTFARDNTLRFYKKANETVVINDPDYMADFEESQPFTSGNITKVAEYRDFKVRVWYITPQDENTFVHGGQDLNIKMSQPWNKVRIQMEQDAFTYLDGATLFVFNGERYKLDQPHQRIGILGEFQFYEIMLQRVN